MPPHGIADVRAHLAKLPVPTSEAERRAMYDRAERVFVVPSTTKVETSRRADGQPSGFVRREPTKTPRSSIFTAAGT